MGVAGGQWTVEVLGVAVAVDVAVAPVFHAVVVGVGVGVALGVAVIVAVEPAPGTGVKVAVGTDVAVCASGLPWLKPHAATTKAMEMASDSVRQLGRIIERSNHVHVRFPTAAIREGSRQRRLPRTRRCVS